MESKHVGIILMFIGLVSMIVVYSYTMNTINLNMELHKNCPLPEGVCPYSRSVPHEAVYGFTLNGALIVFGGYLFIFSKKSEKVGMMKKAEIQKISKSLENDDKKVYQTIVSSDGFIFQNELVEKTGLNKVKITRILDKLEGKGLVERRRRGMSNVVVIKYSV